MTPDEKNIDFVAVSKLAPIMDEIKKSDYINYCLRYAENGSRYYVVRMDDGASSTFADHAVRWPVEGYAEYREHGPEYGTAGRQDG